MTSVNKVLCGRIALSATLWACACQHDSAALFDDAKLPDPPSGGAGPSVAGSQGMPADGGEDAAGGTTSDTAGNAPEGGKATSGAGGGGAMAGSAGTPPTAGSGGKAGEGGTVGGGGTKPDPDPEPVTVEINDFEDAYVASCTQSMNYGEAVTINIDSDNYCTYQGLLSPSLAKVPGGALVSAATLTLYCTNVGGQLTVSYVDDAWKEGTVRWNDRPDAGAAIGNLTCTEVGPITMDLTAAVTAWSSANEDAYGLYFRSEAENGTDFASSEAQDAERRPTLSVTYTLPTK